MSNCRRSALHRKARGFTLLELLVTLAIVSIMATLAAPSLRTIMANQQLSAAASDLMAAALQARSTALKYNRRVIVQPVSGGDWRTGWLIYQDAGLDGDYDAGTDELLGTSPPLPSHITVGSLTGTGDNRSITLIGFDGDGFLASVTAGGTTNFNGSVVFGSNWSSRQKYVVASRTGRIRLCDPRLQANCQP